MRKTSLRNYLLFIMGLNTDISVSDLLDLTFRNIMDDSGAISDTIAVKEKETGEFKTFLINGDLKTVITEYVRQTNGEPDSYLFNRRKGDHKPISRFQAYRIMFLYAVFMKKEKKKIR